MKFTVVVVSAGVSDPSSTRMLADRTAQHVTDAAAKRGHEVTLRVIDVRELAAEIGTALVSPMMGEKLKAAIAALREADGVIASTPVYKAGASGLFTSFFQLLDDDLLIAKPVVLGATAGTARHALVVDQQMRSLFGYLRTTAVPTSLFAAPEDWADTALNRRVERAALELVLLMESGFAQAIRAESWGSYRHEFRSEGDGEIVIDPDMMRLATGGTAT
jgi:FMN reductase